MEASETVQNQGVSTETRSPTHLYRIATLQERFASFVADSIITLYLIAGWGFLLSYLLGARPFAFRGSTNLLFASTALGVYFLYYLFFEGVMTATPGKMLGGLIVHKKGGGIPSLFAIFVRNFFRLVDYPLFFLTGIGLMEMTKKCRRLGDFLSGTVVLKRISFREGTGETEKRDPGSATVRLIAWAFDLLFLIALVFGLLLLIPVEHHNASTVILNLLPLTILFYISLGETLFQTSFGKVLFGLKVVQENGLGPSFSQSLVRTLSWLTDANPLGYLLMVTSGKKQRSGDLVAGTVVVRARRRIRGWLAVPYLLLPAILAASLGWLNPGSFYKRGYEIRIFSQPLTFNYSFKLSLQ